MDEPRTVFEFAKQYFGTEWETYDERFAQALVEWVRDGILKSDTFIDGASLWDVNELRSFFTRLLSKPEGK